MTSFDVATIKGKKKKKKEKKKSLPSKEEKKQIRPCVSVFPTRDVSGFVRLFYILSKNKIFHIFGRHFLGFGSIICHFS